MNLNYFKELAEDTPAYHKALHEAFCKETDNVPELKELRDYVEQTAYGFGERSFYHMWSLIIDEMPQSFTFLEIGVYRGQTLALVQLLAKLKGKECHVTGITPLDPTGGFHESDYLADIMNLHDKFDLKKPEIIKGLSTDVDTVIKSPRNVDIVYIDGGHEKHTVVHDIVNYASRAEKILVIDDCCNDMKMAGGMFPGIQSVTDAVNLCCNQITFSSIFEYLFNVVHNKIWRRVQ